MKNTYLMMAANMKTNTNNYKKYGSIYQNQCVNCIREGTVYCKFEFSDDSCTNFKSLEDLKYTK